MPSRFRGKVSGVLRAIGGHEVVRGVLLPFAVQRALLVGLVFAATRFIPSEPGVQPLPRIPLVDPWIRWDSVYYLMVAQEGYGPNPWSEVDAFFPAYPWLVRGLSPFMPVSVAAFVVANLCALVAIGALYFVVRKLEDVACARRTVWIALLFPTSFFLSAAYAESTYLAALIGCVLAWLHRRHDIAAGCAVVATLARPIGGVCVFVPFALAWLLRGRKRSDVPWFIVAVPAAACVLSITHYWASRDPLAFLHVHDVQALGGSVYFRSTASWWAILQDEGAGTNLMRRLLNWSSLVLVAAATVHLLRRRQLELGLLCALTVATPLVFQRTIFDAAGMARHALVAFPVFWVLARWTQGHFATRAVGSGFAMLQVILAVIFATWRWGE